MKYLRIALLLLVCQCVIFTASYAQQRTRPPEERAAKMTERLKTALTLTDSQTVKAKEINTKTVQSMQELKLKYRDQMQADFKKIEDESDAQYKQVLTADQYAKYLQLKEKKMKKMKGKMHGHH